jgi:hypothetical protein
VRVVAQVVGELEEQPVEPSPQRVGCSLPLDLLEQADADVEQSIDPLVGGEQQPEHPEALDERLELRSNLVPMGPQVDERAPDRDVDDRFLPGALDAGLEQAAEQRCVRAPLHVAPGGGEDVVAHVPLVERPEHRRRRGRDLSREEPPSGRR